jgi:hypothetical protein
VAQPWLLTRQVGRRAELRVEQDRVPWNQRQGGRGRKGKHQEGWLTSNGEGVVGVVAQDRVDVVRKGVDKGRLLAGKAEWWPAQ